MSIEEILWNIIEENGYTKSSFAKKYDINYKILSDFLGPRNRLKKKDNYDERYEILNCILDLYEIYYK